MKRKPHSKHLKAKRRALMKLFSFRLFVWSAIIIIICILLRNLPASPSTYRQSSLQPPITSFQSKKGPLLTYRRATPIPTSAPVPNNRPQSAYQLTLPILMYHYIGNNPDPSDKQRDALSVTPDKFTAQMKYLKDNGYQSISLDTLYAALDKKVTLPAKPVILTFDDGYIDFYYNAYPILGSLNFTATVFIPTGLVGQKAYLTWDQIKEMSASGSVTFGTHSVHHYTLSGLPVNILGQELSDSKNTLQQQLGVPINFMAYPSGSFDGQVIQQAAAAGYLGAVSTMPGKSHSKENIFNIHRVRISGSVDLLTFAALL